ncbi:flavin reductase family protein [Hydrocarboniphaga effusa]|jgi:3-hydroxy-9,10-secoandrosta-1,3,5(10)-triene-9,17-dione monooxygenase reductase component|uniref:flavin reductase family protein n=1 Tax=Hydrocarboniphaga effusa TaxID=243629 RepID=UPI0035B01EF1
MGSIDAKSFRQALGSFTTGVTIVTTVDQDGNNVGVTANSFNSVSLDPPMVLWSIARTSSNIATFTSASHFAVHILASDQDVLASHFSKRGVDRFAGLSPSRGPGGVPLLDGCTARFQCRMAFQYEGGDHLILVGEVLEFDHHDREPLVFKGGRYAFALPKASDPIPAVDASSAPGAFAPDFLIYQLGRAYHQLFARLRPELDRHRLGIADYFALSMLGVRDGRTVSELDRLVSYSGNHVDIGCARRLADLGFVDIGSQADARLTLTSQGQHVVVELLAAAQAANDDAENGFDPSESRLLRQFLNRVITATDPGLPSPWSA